MALPADYLERVYAGVLGKIIGVYLGRPFEGWSYDKIMADLGEVNYYVHEKRGVPLVVTDDDISGTFTFVRALSDYLEDQRAVAPADAIKAFSARHIGQAWLNYIIENKTILWWGGLGNSTEHTAFLRLKKGVEAPQSGSIALNSKVVAEQIGAQIFIDGWAMISPGDPARAARLAREAGSVSHDGEAIYGAQVVAAIEAQAFVERDIHKLLDIAVGFIPKDSVIYTMIARLRELRKTEPDWRKAREFMAANYGYDKFGGNCHMIPNHGLIILALLWGDDDFQKSLMIANTCGWDTDCNSGNVGCIMGIKNGLAGIDAGPDWRGPVADRLYLPTADGGRCLSDAAGEAIRLANLGRALEGQPNLSFKNSARFHFELHGSVQGFCVEPSFECRDLATVYNVPGHSTQGKRSLAIRCRRLATGRAARIATATFTAPDALKMEGYSLFASPTLNPGQVVRAAISAEAANTGPLTVRLYLRCFNDKDELAIVRGPEKQLAPSQAAELSWTIPPTDAQPIAEIGVEIASARPADGTVYLDSLTWSGTPDLALSKPEKHGIAWRRGWVDGCDTVWFSQRDETYRIVKNEGRGLFIYGAREWTDYRVSAVVIPHVARSTGLAARVQGMERYYALLLDETGQAATLVKRLATQQTTLQRASFPWQVTTPYRMELEVAGGTIKGWVDGKLLFNVTDPTPLIGGAVALVVEEGRSAFDKVTIKPAG